MLNLYEFDTAGLPQEEKWICGLYEAAEVKVTHEINSQYTLRFLFPLNNDKSEEITVNRIVECGEQLYRIMTVSKSADDCMLELSCLHVYDADAPTYHIPAFEVMSGVSPREVLEKAFADTAFTVMSEEETDALGMDWLGSDGFLVDFEAVDKTSPYSIAESLIECAGMGEIYRDNYNIAIVTCLGDTGTISQKERLRLSADKNLYGITITKDISEMVNRLYAYGESDAVMTSANPAGLPYIENEASIEKYGLKEGYEDFSEVASAQTLYNYALWEFSSGNENRIDLPKVTIEGKIIDLSRLTAYEDYSEWYGEYEKPYLGKAVYFEDDDGEEYEERITKIEWYPYEPLETSVTIGSIKKDEVFYLTQMGKKIGLNWRIS